MLNIQRNRNLLRTEKSRAHKNFAQPHEIPGILKARRISEQEHGVRRLILINKKEDSSAVRLKCRNRYANLFELKSAVWTVAPQKQKHYKSINSVRNLLTGSLFSKLVSVTPHVEGTSEKMEP